MHHTTGSLYFADCVQAAGISHVFFVPVVFTPSLVALEKRGITPVTTHSEKSAAYMADGYARVSGRPGICLAQTIGSANLAAGLRDAYLARSPVIAVTGGKSPQGKYRGVYQEIDDFAMYEPVTKFNVQVDSAERLADLLPQAFRAATSGCPRPVHLECAGLTGQAIDGEIEVAQGFDDRFLQVPAFRSPANHHDVVRVADLLQRSERPVIVAGGGVASSRAEAEVVALAQKLSIPVATSLNAKGTIPENDPLSIGVVGLYSRECTNKIVCGADVVFYIGSATGSQVTNSWQVPRPGTSVIQLDIEADAAGRNYRNVASLCGDAKTVLQQLIEACSARKPDDWLSDCREQVQSWIAEVRPLVESENSPLRPERICQELSQVLPDDAILVSETGHAGIWTARYVELNSPSQKSIRAAGSLGWGFPASMGAKCAAPDRPVICFSGDGGFYYHMSEMETAVRYGINVVIVINNNRSLNMEKELYADAYGETEQTRGLEMWRFQEMNFAKIAEAMGCFAVRAERPGEVGPAIEKALAAGRPAVVDVVSDTNVLAPLGWAP
jgi:acetolactate synthase-1/2/3 large subunit